MGRVNDTKIALITGASSGIGFYLCQHYLSQGWKVFGISRRRPDELCQNPLFSHQSIDLGDEGAIKELLPGLLDDVSRLDLVILNAGVLGRFGDLRDASLQDLEHTMRVNVWCNTTMLDVLHSSEVKFAQLVAISSGASINGNRGWSGYSISKSALNMLVKLLAAENPTAHFCSLAPGLVDTPMQDLLCSQPVDERFPSLNVLRSKRQLHEMPSGSEAAIILADVIGQLPNLCSSGEYVDIRQLPEKKDADVQVD